MRNYKVQIMWDPNKKTQRQRTVLVTDMEDDVKALIIAKAYFGDNIGYDSITIAKSTPDMEKRITEVI